MLREMGPDELRRALKIGGIAVWLMVGVPVFAGGINSATRLAGWAAAYLAFLALFLLALRTGRLLAIAGQAACVVALVLTLCDGFKGALLVLGALQLGGLVSRRRGLLWIALQSAARRAATGAAVPRLPAPRVLRGGRARARGAGARGAARCAGQAGGDHPPRRASAHLPGAARCAGAPPDGAAPEPGGGLPHRRGPRARAGPGGAVDRSDAPDRGARGRGR